MTYKPPYTINSKMIEYISDIMKLIGYISNSQNLTNKPLLRRTNKINSIYSSLAIENNVLSKDQVRDIINGKPVIGPMRDIIEVQNAINCYDNILNINPFDIKELLKCHQIMMNGLIEDAGNFRIKQEGVFDGDTVIFIAPSAELVPELIANLYEYLNDASENFLIKSCVFHYEFEFIHPFSDGNGRIGRLFQTCILAKSEEIFAFLPIESIIKERQDKYYESIAKCNQLANSDIFIEFMLDSIRETINRVLESNKTMIAEIPIYVDKLINVMKDNKAYMAKELLDLLHLKSLATLKKNYINPALDLGFIEMTIPDMPTNRNQRYRKIINTY